MEDKTGRHTGFAEYAIRRAAQEVVARELAISGWRYLDPEEWDCLGPVDSRLTEEAYAVLRLAGVVAVLFYDLPDLTPWEMHAWLRYGSTKAPESRQHWYLRVDVEYAHRVVKGNVREIVWRAGRIADEAGYDGEWFGRALGEC